MGQYNVGPLERIAIDVLGPLSYTCKHTWKQVFADCAGLLYEVDSLFPTKKLGQWLES